MVIPTTQMSRVRLVYTAQQRHSSGAGLGCRRLPLPSVSVRAEPRPPAPRITAHPNFPIASNVPQREYFFLI